MSARSRPAISSSWAASSSALLEWKTPVTSRVRVLSSISSRVPAIGVFHLPGVMELGQVLQCLLGRAWQRDFLSLVVNGKAVVRHRHETSAEADKAADLQDREIQLLLVRDHIVEGPDLLGFVVDDAAAEELAHSVTLPHHRKVDLHKRNPGLRQGRASRESKHDRETEPDERTDPRRRVATAWNCRSRSVFAVRVVEEFEGDHSSLLRLNWFRFITPSEPQSR